MYRNNRWKGYVRKADSKWETKLAEGVLSGCFYHESIFDVEYSIPKTYQPDFVCLQEDGTGLYIEAKGRFLDREEARKYKYIKEELQEGGDEFVFLFYDPNKPMPHAKVRKDGTKLTHGEWATLNDFEWYTEETIIEIL